MQIDFKSLAADLLSRSRELLPTWFPEGKIVGAEFVIGNLQGDAGDSLSINLHTGKWADFAGDARGGDLISLYAAKYGLRQAEAAEQLSNGAARMPAANPSVTAATARSAPRTERVLPPVIAPVPAGTKECDCITEKLGIPTKVWRYVDAAGGLMGYVARYDPLNQRKIYMPWTFDGKRWKPRKWPAPAPLYGLDDLARDVKRPVIVTEGEKAADAARELAGLVYAVVTWPGGANAVALADWKHLHGRRVILWPDADRAGLNCMYKLGAILKPYTASLHWLSVKGMPDGWDAADALASGSPDIAGAWNYGIFKTWAKPRASAVPVDGVDQFGDTVPAAASAPRAGDTPEDPAPQTSSLPAPDPASLTRPDPIAEALETATGMSYGSLAIRWAGLGLSLNGQGIPHPNMDNAVHVIEGDPTLHGRVWYDTFLQRLQTEPQTPRDWTDGDDLLMTHYMQRSLSMNKMGLDAVRQAVHLVAARFPRNCLQDSLNALPSWDKTPRCDMFFVDCFGAEQSHYSLSVGGNFWKSLVARARQPGCKVDNMVILEGLQGIQKSTACAVIVGEAFFTEAHESVTSKDFYVALQGKWLIEINEMDAFSRAEVTKINQVITCRTDRYRPPYGRTALDHPRQSIFIGTTNRDDYNRDETGFRRGWPIRCADIRIDVIRENRLQLLAEAIHRVAAGESWWEMPVDQTHAEQAARYIGDPWDEVVRDYVDMLDETTTAEVLRHAVDMPLERIGLPDQRRIAAILRHIGWRKIPAARRAGKVLNVWRRPAELARVRATP